VAGLSITLLILRFATQARAATARCRSVAFNANSSQGAFPHLPGSENCTTANAPHFAIGLTR
jgi:hypothetical protein